MAEGDHDATLDTLHGDLADLKGETRTGFADVKEAIADLKGETRTGFADVSKAIGDLKVTMITGFAGLPTREASEEMIRLLREGHRMHETRFAQIDGRIREQHLETQHTLRALAESQRALIEGTQAIRDGHQGLRESQQALLAEIRALIARIDAILRRRNNGDSAA